MKPKEFGHGLLRLCSSADLFCVFQYQVARAVSATRPNRNRMVYGNLFDGKAFSFFRFRWKERGTGFRMEIEVTGDNATLWAIIGKVLTAGCFRKREPKSRVV